jgi:hypothetical protein
MIGEQRDALIYSHRSKKYFQKIFAIEWNKFTTCLVLLLVVQTLTPTFKPTHHSGAKK